MYVELPLFMELLTLWYDALSDAVTPLRSARACRTGGCGHAAGHGRGVPACSGSCSVSQQQLLGQPGRSHMRHAHACTRGRMRARAHWVRWRRAPHQYSALTDAVAARFDLASLAAMKVDDCMLPSQYWSAFCGSGPMVAGMLAGVNTG